MRSLWRQRALRGWTQIVEEAVKAGGDGRTKLAQLARVLPNLESRRQITFKSVAYKQTGEIIKNIYRNR